jgi:hypothetical protein
MFAVPYPSRAIFVCAALCAVPVLRAQDVPPPMDQQYSTGAADDLRQLGQIPDAAQVAIPGCGIAPALPCPEDNGQNVTPNQQAGKTAESAGQALETVSTVMTVPEVLTKVGAYTAAAPMAGTVISNSLTAVDVAATGAKVYADLQRGDSNAATLDVAQKATELAVKSWVVGGAEWAGTALCAPAGPVAATCGEAVGLVAEGGVALGSLIQKLPCGQGTVQDCVTDAEVSVYLSAKSLLPSDQSPASSTVADPIPRPDPSSVPDPNPGPTPAPAPAPTPASTPDPAADPAATAQATAVRLQTPLADLDVQTDQTASALDAPDTGSSSSIRQDVENTFDQLSAQNEEAASAAAAQQAADSQASQSAQSDSTGLAILTGISLGLQQSAAVSQKQAAPASSGTPSASAIPAGWEACTCPAQHASIGRYINGTLYHPVGPKCNP